MPSRRTSWSALRAATLRAGRTPPEHLARTCPRGKERIHQSDCRTKLRGAYRPRSDIDSSSSMVRNTRTDRKAPGRLLEAQGLEAQRAQCSLGDRLCEAAHPTLHLRSLVSGPQGPPVDAQGEHESHQASGQTSAHVSPRWLALHSSQGGCLEFSDRQRVLRWPPDDVRVDGLGQQCGPALTVAADEHGGGGLQEVRVLGRVDARTVAEHVPALCRAVLRGD